MILKNQSNDTCFSEKPIAGWVEIGQDEFEEICQSRRVDLDPVSIVSEKLAVLRITREAILNRLSGIALAAQLSGDTATTSAYVTVRQGLLDMTSGLAELAPELVDATVLQRYALLVAQCTPAMVSAFSQVDA